MLFYFPWWIEGNIDSCEYYINLTVIIILHWNVSKLNAKLFLLLFNPLNYFDSHLNHNTPRVSCISLLHKLYDALRLQCYVILYTCPLLFFPLFKGFQACSSSDDAPAIVCISKMFPVEKKMLPENRQK